MPILLALMLVAGDLGRVYFTMIQLNNAVREAANYGAVQPTDNQGMLDRANAERNTQSQTGQTDVLASSNISVTCATPAGVTIVCADSAGEAWGRAIL